MIPIVFRLNSSNEPDVACISIQPTDVRWNDFGYNFHANINFRLKNAGPTLTLRASIIPIEISKGEAKEPSLSFNSWLGRELSSSGKSELDLETDINKLGNNRFITLLQGEASYRKLAEYVTDSQSRVALLLRLNDLVMLRESKTFESLTHSLMQSKGFQLGVMRTGSAFRALHRGRRYLWGSFWPTTVSDARQTFTFKCALKGFQGNPHTISVKFIDNEIIADRVHCIVGRNGTGKSRLLYELISHLGKLATTSETGTPFLDDLGSTARKDLTSYIGPEYTRVIAISSDSESIFPLGVRSDSRFEYYLANLHKTDVEEGGTNVSTRLLVDLMRGSDDIGQKSRWQHFRDALREYINISDLHLPILSDAGHDKVVTIGELKWVSAADLKSAGEQASLELYALLDLSREVCFLRAGKEVRPSSGERMYFRFALNLLSHIDNASILIIDEPETHLHPNLVCDFMNLLYEVLTATQSIALIATHSAYIVREVPTHCAHILSINEDREPIESFAYLKTLGASIESISQAIFSDSNSKKFHRKLVNSMAAEGKTIEELIDAYSKFISPEMLSQVAQQLDKKNASEEEE